MTARVTAPASGCLPPDPLGKSFVTCFAVEWYCSQRKIREGLAMVNLS